MLAGCYRYSLALAAQHGLRTIAFPSISTGACGFPMECVARIAVREIRQFLETHPELEKVLLVCFGQTAFDLHLRVLSEHPG